MRSLIIVSLTFVAACTRGVIAPECPEDTDTAVADTDTEVEDTDVVEPAVQPVLTVEYTTTLSGYGDWQFQSGEQDVRFGGFYVATNSFAKVESITIQGFVSDSPGLFSYYRYGEENGVRFADHFTRCELVDATTGAIQNGPVDPAADGTITFNDMFTLDTSSGMILHVQCDHTGMPVAGDVDGFAIDITSDLNVSATDANGQYEPVDLRVRNGADNPSTTRILLATEPEECPLFNDSTTSKPVLQLWTTEMMYPSSLDWFTGEGMFYTASGCGTGYTVVDVAVLLEDLPTADFTDTQMTVAVGGNTYNTVCDADGTELWCTVHGVNVDVLSGQSGVGINFTAMDVPTIPVGHEMEATVYYHWQDLDTGNGYQTNGWYVEVADSVTVRTY